MTWGQVAIWDVLRWLHPDTASLNQVAVRPVPDGRSVPDAVDALRLLVLRHESLRSTYTDTDGVLEQHVHRQARLDVPVHRAGSAAEADRTAERLAAELGGRAFAVGEELPVRAAVVGHGGTAHAVVLVIAHMAVDGGSFRIVLRDFDALLRAGAAAELPPRAQQPLERRDFEESKAGLARSERTLAHWRRAVGTGSRATLEHLPAPRDADLAWASIDSRALGTAVQRVSARSGVGPSAVVLGSIGLLIARLTGEDHPLLRSLTATRFKPHDQELVGAFNQNALIRTDTSPGRFDDYLARVSTATLSALRTCEADPRQVEATVAEAARARGFTPGSYCFFNDIITGRGVTTAPPGELPPDADEIRAARADTELRQLPYAGRQMDSKFFVFLHDVRPRCVLRLCKDRRFLPGVDAAGFLARLENLLVSAATSADPTLEELSHER